MIDGLILQLGIPGGPEVLLILLLAVLLFGANKIPKLARSTGQAMGEFQKGRQQVEEELEEMQETTDLSADPPGSSSESESTTSTSGTETNDPTSDSTETNRTSE